MIVRPETVLDWQRKRFKRYWCQLSQHKNPGRPRKGSDIRKLVKAMAEANLSWGAPRIHGELLKLGIEISERTVSRLMPQRHTAPSQTWRTFLDNHVRDLVSVDFFTVPTARLHVLFVFIVLSHERRRVIHFNHRTSDGGLDRPTDNRKRFLRIKRHAIFSEIATASMVNTFKEELREWALRKCGLLHKVHGKIHTPRG